MNRTTLATATLLLVLCAAPCLDAQQPPTSASREQQQKAQQRRRGDRNKITKVELEEAGSAVTTAHDAVRVLRPQWFQPPFGRNSSSSMGSAGSGNATTVVVYVDDIQQPDVESLKTVAVLKVVEMRYLDQNRAIALRGPGHEAGVIEVTTVDKKK